MGVQYVRFGVKGSPCAYLIRLRVSYNQINEVLVTWPAASPSNASARSNSASAWARAASAARHRTSDSPARSWNREVAIQQLGMPIYLSIYLFIYTYIN